MNRNALLLFTIFEIPKVGRIIHIAIDIDIHNWKMIGSLVISSNQAELYEEHPIMMKKWNTYISKDCSPQIV